MAETIRNPETDVTVPLSRTANGLGWVWQLEPGKRVVLDQYDQWVPEPGKDMLLAVHEERIVFSPKEEARRERGAMKLKERLSSVPFYAKRAAEEGNNYWRKLYASGINS